MSLPAFALQFAEMLANPALLGFAALMFGSPGPNNFMLVATGVNFGIRRGLPHLFGVAGGFAAMFVLVASGLGAAIRSAEYALDVIRILGALMLLFLAYKIAVTAPASHAEGGHTAQQSGKPINFLQAAAFQWVNPKAWIICFTVSALFLGGAHTHAAQTHAAVTAAPLALILFCVSLPCNFCWLLFGVQIKRWLQKPRRRVLFNRCMAVALVLSGAGFFV